jgi:hypothetical protein
MPERRTTGKLVPVSLSDKNFLAAGYGGAGQFTEIKQWIDAITLRLRANPYYCRHSTHGVAAPDSPRAEQP